MSRHRSLFWPIYSCADAGPQATGEAALAQAKSAPARLPRQMTPRRFIIYASGLLRYLP